MTPLWPHDCEFCKFLGTYGRVDMYYCPVTVIARYGPEERYVSGITFAKMEPIDERYMALRVAYLIAKDSGLLKE